MGTNTEALKSFQAALELDGNFLPAQLGMAQALADVNPPAAGEMAKKVLAKDPDSVPAHLLRQFFGDSPHDFETDFKSNPSGENSAICGPRGV